MSVIITYDKDGNKIPSREFLSMVIVLLRKCEVETDMSLVQWLEGFGDLDDQEVDIENDKSLRSAVYKMLKENYLDQEEAKNAQAN